MTMVSDGWRLAGVHWHCYAETGPYDRTDDRAARLKRPASAVQCTPQAVVDWLDRLTRRYVDRAETWTTTDGWVRIGDEADLAHLRAANYLIACRGDSIYTDIFCIGHRHDLYAEAVTDEQCTHGCAQHESAQR